MYYCTIIITCTTSRQKPFHNLISSMYPGSRDRKAPIYRRPMLSVKCVTQGHAYTIYVSQNAIQSIQQPLVVQQ